MFDETEQERVRRKMFEICQEVIAEMVHTKDGSRVVREFLAQGTPKVHSVFPMWIPEADRISRIENRF